MTNSSPQVSEAVERGARALCSMMSGRWERPGDRALFRLRAETVLQSARTPSLGQEPSDFDREVMQRSEARVLAHTAELGFVVPRTPSDETAQQQHGSPEPTAITSTGRLDAGASATPSDQGVGEAVEALLWKIEAKCHTETRTQLLELVHEALAAIAQNTVPSGKDMSDEVREVVERLEAGHLDMSAPTQVVNYADVEKTTNLLHRISGEGVE